MTTLPLAGYRQARAYTCGFTTALMVLHHFEVEVSAQELFRQLGTDRNGTRQNAILRALRGAGLRASIRYDMDFARLCRAIDLRKLIIGYLGDIEHWLVIYGYGRDPDRVYVADPRPDEGCEHLWQDYAPRLGQYGLICSRAGEAIALRQTQLGLDHPEPTAALARPAEELDGAPPPLPILQLRCEVHGGPEPSPPPQLLLPF